MADSFNLEAYRLSDERWPDCAQCSHYFQPRKTDANCPNRRDKSVGAYHRLDKWSGFDFSKLPPAKDAWKYI